MQLINLTHSVLLSSLGCSVLDMPQVLCYVMLDYPAAPWQPRIAAQFLPQGQWEAWLVFWLPFESCSILIQPDQILLGFTS